jgi:hypothetical protein
MRKDMTMKKSWKNDALVIGLSTALGITLMSAAGLAAFAQTPPPPKDAPPEARGERMIEHMGGKDGVITREDARGPLKDHFDEVDTNKDGKVTLAELEVFHKDHGPPPGGGCRPMMGPMMGMRGEGPEHGPEHGPKPHPELDANKDGKVTLEEFLAMPKALFARLDANHNGTLEGKELPHMGKPGECPPDGPPPPPPAQ